MPTISIEKTDGCQMFLSKDSVNTEIISAKSSEMNVMIPNGDEFVSSTLFFCLGMTMNIVEYDYLSSRLNNPCPSSSRLPSRA